MFEALIRVIGLDRMECAHNRLPSSCVGVPQRYLKLGACVLDQKQVRRVRQQSSELRTTICAYGPRRCVPVEAIDDRGPARMQVRPERGIGICGEQLRRHRAADRIRHDHALAHTEDRRDCALGTTRHQFHCHFVPRSARIAMQYVDVGPNSSTRTRTRGSQVACSEQKAARTLATWSMRCAP